MIKGYRYRIYPNSEQQKALAQMFGNARYIYNWRLDLCIKARESGEKKPSAFDLHKLLTQHKKEEGKETLNAKASGADIEKYFIEILPNYDRERVYTSDMKKVLNWYNILYKEGLITEEVFAEKPEAEIIEVAEKAAE